ncbi:MAG: glycosyltransferase family 9 protein [Rikenellaceae bacterium]
MPKFLIIRLSSIGDIIQCMSVVGGIRKTFPDAEIHWVVRSDMQQTLSIDNRIDKVWAFDKKEGFSGLIKLTKELKKEKFDYVYDAHCNIRSAVIKSKLRCLFSSRPKIVTRSKNRVKRVLLFKFRINRFPNPFVGMDSFRKPLKKFGITDFSDDFSDYRFPSELEDKFKGLVTENCITIVPSANWEMKRWSVGHWKSLIELLPDYKFIVLGGPTDTFCEDICSVAPERTINMAGKSSIMGSSYIISQSKFVISGDTGFLHSADMFKIPTIALMGPSAFGYPANKSSVVLSLDLKCMPCTKDGRGKCKDKKYKRCLEDITPKMVSDKVIEMINER